MIDYSRRVKVPAPAYINSGLSSCPPTTLLARLGKPRSNFTEECSSITNPVLARSIVTMDVGPFKLTGHKKFLLIITDMFREIKIANPTLYSQVHTAGCLCVRHIRGISNQWSNHSWGTAVDLFFGATNDRVGDGMCQTGLLEIYKYAHPRRLYWGAEFGKNDPAREDSMHVEASKELAQSIF